MTFRIYPYKLASQSARRLKEALGGRPLLKQNSNYRLRENDIVINWGSSIEPNFTSGYGRILNSIASVAIASNKLACLEALVANGIPTLEYTTDRNIAEQWEENIYARKLLRSHSGKGIVYVGIDDEVPQAPLYTKAKNNTGEYRVHVMNNTIIDYRKKTRREGDEATPEQNIIRTLGNGWIYQQGDINRIERVEELALDAIEALGLDFGAVDIIKDENGDVFVIEVNTAIGLADNTLASYITGFQHHYA